MSYTAERGNFEGRSRARGGFGNETGQTERRGDSGEAERANRNAMSRAATMAGPRGPFKSPVYDSLVQNATALGTMIGPMLANPGIGLAAPLAQSILSGDVYGAFGLPSGWSAHSPRDIDPMGRNPRGNISGRDDGFRDTGLTPNQRSALVAEGLRRQQLRPKAPPEPPMRWGSVAPATISDQLAGLPIYGVTRPGYKVAVPGQGKAAGYGGVARSAPIAHPESYF